MRRRDPTPLQAGDRVKVVAIRNEVPQRLLGKSGRVLRRGNEHDSYWVGFGRPVRTRDQYGYHVTRPAEQYLFARENVQKG